MSIMELGTLGEFQGVFALVATSIYLSIQVRQARNESANAVLEARAMGIRELHMGVATSDSLSAAMESRSLHALPPAKKSPRALKSAVVRNTRNGSRSKRSATPPRYANVKQSGN